MPQLAGRRSSRAQSSRGVRLTDARPWDRRLLMRPRPDQIGMVWSGAQWTVKWTVWCTPGWADRLSLLIL